LRDGDGHKLPVKVHAEFDALRFVQVTDQKLFGADWVWHVIVPVVHQSLDVGGAKTSTSGLGDITVDPFVLAWHSPTWHYATGLTSTCPRVSTARAIFGPCCHIAPFDTEAEAVALATDYGLATTVWTQDLGTAHRMAAAIEVGLVWINSWFLRDLRTAFGGAGASGIGREGGVHSLEFYTELKNVMIKL
jgi:hypothetical protein